MNDEQLSQVMERIAEKAVPAGSSIWDKVEANFQAESKVKRMPQRYNWAAIVVAVFAITLLTTGGALAYILLTQFPTDAGAGNVAASGQGIILTESATVNGVTIRMVHAYADTERVLLFYTLENIDPTRFNHRAPEAEMMEIFNFGDIDQYQSIDGLQYQYRLDEGKVLFVSSMPHDATGETVDFFWQLIVNNLGDVVPPEFHFNFSVPIEESVSIPVNQSVEAQGLTITLETIELSAASTKVRICTTLPDEYDYAEFNDMGLLINGELFAYEYGTEENDYEGQRYCMSQSFKAGIVTGSESLEVMISGLYIAPVPSQEEVDSAIAELAVQGIQAEITLVDGHTDWEIISYPEGYNAEVWLSGTLYDMQGIEVNHTFSIKLSELVLANR